MKKVQEESLRKEEKLMKKAMLEHEWKERREKMAKEIMMEVDETSNEDGLEILEESMRMVALWAGDNWNMVEMLEHEEMDIIMTDLGIRVTTDTSELMETDAHIELDEIADSVKMEIANVEDDNDTPWSNWNNEYMSEDNDIRNEYPEGKFGDKTNHYYDGTWYLSKWWPVTHIRKEISRKHQIDIKVLAEKNKTKLLQTDLLRIRIVMGNTDADIFDGNILGKRQLNSAGCWWLTPATRPSTLGQRWPGSRFGIQQLHPETDSMKHQQLWKKLYLICEQCPEVDTVNSRARPREHHLHHCVGAEEERVQGPSDGQVGCGGGLPRGVQHGDQGDELQLQAGGLADGGDDCTPVRKHFQLVRRKYRLRNGVKRDGLPQVTMNNFIIGGFKHTEGGGGSRNGSVGGAGGGGIKRKRKL